MADTVTRMPAQSQNPTTSQTQHTPNLKLNIKLIDLIDFQLRFSDPLLHLSQRKNPLPISNDIGIELHIIGDKARHNRRIHRISSATLAEQIRPTVFFKTLTPDRHNTINIRLRPRPHLKS